MRHPSLLISLLTLFIAAGIVLIAGSFILQPAAPPAAAPANTEVIRRFYAAANETIATGETTALHSVVAPHFVDQDPLPGMKPDRSGLEDYLIALHAVVPDTELLAEAIVAGGDRAMARVAVHRGAGPTPLSGTVVDQPAPWGPVDVFRVAGGKVVERWSRTDDLTLARPVIAVTLDIPAPTPRVISLERFTFEPSAVWSLPPAGSRLIVVESGVLRVDITAADRALGGNPGAERSSHASDASDIGRDLTLRAGGSSLVPADALLTLTNAGSGDARVLAVTFSEPHSPGGAAAINFLPPGVAGQTLAGGLATDIQMGPAALVLGQVTLARNARLSLSSTDGPTLMAVETGHLTVETWGRAWLRRGRDGMSVDPREQLMARGDGLLMHQGGLTRFHNGGDNPAVVHVLTLRTLK
ncbi:MAG TPA: ester cyclase [Thermomicrobiales bacterium]|nr:ester cyclase [Thermomicrobiales bacterium]